MSVILQTLKSLKALLKGKQQFKKSLDNNFLSIILFLCSSTFFLRIIKCGLRKLRNKDDGFNSFLAGVGAGIAGIITLNKDYWYILLMFVGSRVIGAFYNLCLKKEILNRQNINLHNYILFVIANAINSYGYFVEPDILKPDMFNLYDKMAILTPT